MKQCEASIAIQVLPTSSGDKNMLPVIESVIDYIRSTGLNTYVGPFETTVEGDFDTLMDIIKEAQRICIREGAPGVASYVKIFYNPTVGVMSIDAKVTKYHE